MTSDITIRQENKRDINRVANIIKEAFYDQSFSNQQEHLLVEELRNQGELAVSLVAEIKRQVVGHIGFSKVLTDGDHVDWYGFALVSVNPKYQQQGVGSSLIRAGLAQLKQQGAQGCVVLGEPDYYKRFGFHRHEGLIMKDVPPEYFLVLSFHDDPPSGIVTYHDLFTTFD